MAPVCLFELNIAWIFPEDCYEEHAEDNVAEELEKDGESCAIKNKWQNTIRARCDAWREVHQITLWSSVGPGRVRAVCIVSWFKTGQLVIGEVSLCSKRYQLDWPPHPKSIRMPLGTRVQKLASHSYSSSYCLCDSSCSVNIDLVRIRIDECWPSLSRAARWATCSTIAFTPSTVVDNDWNNWCGKTVNTLGVRLIAIRAARDACVIQED